MKTLKTVCELDRNLTRFTYDTTAFQGWRLCISQGLENRIIEPEFGSADEGEVNCRDRLGGLLRCYYRDAA